MAEGKATKTNAEKSGEIVYKRVGDIQGETVRPQAFVKPEIKPRRIEDFERIRQRDILQQGLKVQLGPSTLKELLTVKLPDENNPSILVEKSVPFSQLMHDANGRAAAIRELLERVRVGANINSINVRNDLNKMATAVKVSLNKIQKLNGAKFADIIEALKNLNIPFNPSDAGLPEAVTMKDFNDQTRGSILAWLVTPQIVQNFEKLTPSYPVYGVSGHPLSVTAIPGNLAKGYVLSLWTRKMYKTMKEYEDDPDEISIVDVELPVHTPIKAPRVLGSAEGTTISSELGIIPKTTRPRIIESPYKSIPRGIRPSSSALDLFKQPNVPFTIPPPEPTTVAHVSDVTERRLVLSPGKPRRGSIPAARRTEEEKTPETVEERNRRIEQERRERELLRKYGANKLSEVPVSLLPSYLSELATLREMRKGPKKKL